MKKLTAAFAALVSATAAFAATPIAVWHGDFEARFSGCTLNLNGNALSADKSTITIDQTYAGVDINFATPVAGASGITVLVEYSGLAKGDKAKALATSCVTSSYDKDRTGVDLQANNLLFGMWYDNGWADYGTRAGEIAAEGYMAFTYNKDGGTYLHTSESAGKFPANATWGSSGLRSGSDNSIYGATIGGMRSGTVNTNWRAASGMQITGIAVFGGVLTVDELNEYSFPSSYKVVTAGENASFSALSTEIGDVDTAYVHVPAGSRVAVNGAFAATKVYIISDGSITLTASSKPDASLFANIDFAGVAGGVLRSWLTPGVIGFNFNAANGADTSKALVEGTWYSNASDKAGSTTEFFDDGLSTLTWSSDTLWQGGSVYFTDGYLDDGANNGHGAEVSLANVPYETYDVIIYAATDSGNNGFTAKVVNGKSYTWDAVSSSAVEGTSTWGKPGLITAIYGLNALRIKNLTGPLTIYGNARNSSYRGGIAAIQIMPTDAAEVDDHYTLSINGDTSWSGGAWTRQGETVAAPATAGANVNIELSASATLTLDQSVNLGAVKVTGAENAVLTVVKGSEATSYAATVCAEAGVLQLGGDEVFGSTPILRVENGATLDMNGHTINSATAVHIAGAGAGDWPWALTSSGGAGGPILGGLYLSADATIGGENELKIGQTGAGYYCYLNSCKLTKTGNGALTCTNMNTPGQGEIDLQGGAMSVNQWNNLNSASGETTLTLRDGAEFIQSSGSHAIAVNTFNFLGGTLTTTNPFYIKSLMTGGGETAKLVFRPGATASLSRSLTVSTALTLDGAMTFSKAEDAAEDIVVTASGTISANGPVTVGAGVTLNVGTGRPSGVITVEEGGALAIMKSGASDVPQVNVASLPASVVLYDENGAVVASPKVVYDAEAGTLAFYTGNIWTANESASFDAPANWSSGAPSSGDSVTVQISGDTEISLSGEYDLGEVVVSGDGNVTFVGSGTIAASTLILLNGVAVERTAAVSATAGIVVGANSTLKIAGVNESAAISGAGAVETYGDVTFGGVNTFTGGLTVKTGTAKTTTGTGFGGSTTDGTYRITVEDGACLDIGGTKDATHSITISGKGVLLPDGSYSGAVVNSGVAMGSGTRQTRSLTLAADAMVDVSSGWGIVRSAHAASILALNGHTLTIRGAGTVPMVNVNTESGCATTGTIVLEGATLQLAGVSSNFAGVDVIAKGCASIDLAVAPTALGSLTIAPGVTGTTASNWNLPAGCVPVVNTSNVDVSGLANGATVVLFTDNSQSLEYGSNIEWQVGGRFEGHNDAHQVTATFTAGVPQPFLHYDFDNGAAVDTGKAPDSKYQITSVGEAGSETLAGSRNGKAVQVHTGYTPYWGSNSNGHSPVHAGEVTVTTVAKLNDVGVVMWGLGSSKGSNTAIGLVALAANSAAVAIHNADGSVSIVSTVTIAGDLTKEWHFFAIVSNINGTTLWVDDLAAASATPVPLAASQAGQLGSFYDGAVGASKVGTDGYWLDDWRVYDAALDWREIKEIKRQLLPSAFRLYLR